MNNGEKHLRGTLETNSEEKNWRETLKETLERNTGEKLNTLERKQKHQRESKKKKTLERNQKHQREIRNTRENIEHQR